MTRIVAYGLITVGLLAFMGVVVLMAVMIDSSADISYKFQIIILLGSGALMPVIFGLIVLKWLDKQAKQEEREAMRNVLPPRRSGDQKSE